MTKSRVGNILPKAATLHINLNLDGAPIASKSHTHPSHSQTSRLLTSSLSVMSLLDTRVGGTHGKLITKRVYLKLPATTTREGFLHNHWDLDVHDGGKECLSETSRPCLISVMSLDLSQSDQKKRTHLGTSSSLDSRTSISVRRTESSTVATMCYWERKVTCSVRHETTNISDKGLICTQESS
jgi:hypothetical protein